MASKVAQRRLQKEYLSMQKGPPPFIWACPEEKNILDWHFIVRGPPDSPYAGGEYHGLIWFPPDYPFKPPDIKMFTPTGRFAVGQKICMSMTSYHPSTWNAAWSVATILTGLLSFMLSEEVTAGSIRTTEEEKRALAKQSHAFNLQSKKFREIFPKYATPEMTDLPDMGQQALEVESFSEPTCAAIDAPLLPVIERPQTQIPSPVQIQPQPQPQQQPQPLPHQPRGWQWREAWWRWAIAVVLFAVLGRISSRA